MKKPNPLDLGPSRVERITPLRSNLLGYNAVISYPAKRAAAPLFRNSQPKGTRPLSKPRCALRLPCARQGPDDLQPGLTGHADNALHGGVYTGHDGAGIDRAEGRRGQVTDRTIDLCNHVVD